MNVVLPERIIVHVDMDAFFAAIEQRDNPSFRGKPVIIGGEKEGNRGVVSTASYEARIFGIHSAMPIFQAKQRCPHGIYISGNYQKYQKISRKIMNVFHSISPAVQQVSIDEAYLDCTGEIPYFLDKKDIGTTIQKRIFSETELTCSVGIAPNKMVAKIASDYKKPSGITIVRSQNMLSFLEKLSVKKVNGIGTTTTKKLSYFGVITIGDLKKLSLDFLTQKFGKSGVFLFKVARGVDTRPVINSFESNNVLPKSISKEITFPHHTRDRVKLTQLLRKLTHAVTYRLRTHHACAKKIIVKIRYTDLTIQNFSTTLDVPINYEPEIFYHAEKLLDALSSIRAVRLIGLQVCNIQASNHDQQLDIFQQKNKKLSQVSAAVDDLKKRFGETIIKIGE